jgi:transposase
LHQACLPGMNVSHVARLHEVSPSLVFHWRRVLINGGKDAVRPDEDDGGNREIRALAARVRELESMLAKTMLEIENVRQEVRAALERRIEAAAIVEPKIDSEETATPVV